MGNIGHNHRRYQRPDNSVMTGHPHRFTLYNAEKLTKMGFGFVGGEKLHFCLQESADYFG